MNACREDPLFPTPTIPNTSATRKLNMGYWGQFPLRIIRWFGFSETIVLCRQKHDDVGCLGLSVWSLRLWGSISRWRPFSNYCYAAFMVRIIEWSRVSFEYNLNDESSMSTARRFTLYTYIINVLVQLIKQWCRMYFWNVSRKFTYETIVIW